MRKIAFPYYAAFGLAVTICSNLQGFFILGRISRWMINNWNDIINSIWRSLFGIFNIHVSNSASMLMTGIFIIFSLASTSMSRSKGGVAHKIENLFDPVFCHAIETDIENTKNGTGIIENMKSWGVTYILFMTIYQAMMFFVWYVLFYPFLSQFGEGDGWFLFYIQCVLVYTIIAHFSIIFLSGYFYSKFIMTDDERNHYFSEIELSKGMNNYKNQKIMEKFAKDVMGKTISRIFSNDVECIYNYYYDYNSKRCFKFGRRMGCN